MSNSTTDLGKESIGRLLLKLATPSIIAQLVNVLYNIVDRIFIGRMQNGDVAMAGIGVAFPIVLLVSAFAAFVGMGGAPLAAIKMGEKDNNEAEKIMTNSFSVLLIIAGILTVIFMIFKEPILWKFGASESTIKYATDYLGIYLIGTVFVQIALGMNPFVNTQGFAKIGMMTVTIGAIINIILDPILIFGLNMGVKGAAVATIVAQAVSAIWVLRFLTGKKTILKLRKKYLKIDIKTMKPVFALGIAPFIMQSTESLVLVSLNSQLQKYGGDLAVGAMTILSSCMQFAMLPLQGLTQGGQPIISYNYGANNSERVKKGFKLILLSSLIYTSIIWLIAMFAPQLMVMIFTNDADLVPLTVWALRIYMAGMIVMGAQVACQQTFIAFAKPKISTFLALFRKIIVLIPLIYLLPTFMENDVEAVFLAEPIADFIATTTTVILFIITIKKLLKGMREKEKQKEIKH